MICALHQPLLHEIGWDVAKLLGPYIVAPSEEASYYSDVASNLFTIISNEYHARELAMFTVEHLATIDWDGSGDMDEKVLRRNVAIFIPYGRAWMTGNRP